MRPRVTISHEPAVCHRCAASIPPWVAHVRVDETRRRCLRCDEELVTGVIASE